MYGGTGPLPKGAEGSRRGRPTHNCDDHLMHSSASTHEEVMYIDMYMLSQQTKVYQHSYYNSQVTYNKWMKSKDKLDATRNATQRRKKAMEKEAEVSPG